MSFYATKYAGAELLSKINVYVMTEKSQMVSSTKDGVQLDLICKGRGHDDYRLGVKLQLQH